MRSFRSIQLIVLGLAVVFVASNVIGGIVTTTTSTSTSTTLTTSTSTSTTSTSTTTTSTTTTSTTSTSSTGTTSTSTSSTVNVAPYEESFESYGDGLSIGGVNGWVGELNAANTSDDPGLIAKLTDYANAGRDFPLPGETHTNVLCVNDAQTITNCIVANNTDVFTDFLWLPQRSPGAIGGVVLPPAGADDQLIIFVSDQGLLTVWHDYFGTNEFHVLANSPVISTTEWTRISIEQNYSGDRYRVKVNQASPIEDAKGWDAAVGGSQPGSWLNMVQKSGSMSFFGAASENGAAYLDDLHVKFVDPVPTTTTTTSTTSTSTTSTTSTSTTSTTSTSSTTTTSSSTIATSTTSSTTFTNVVPYEEPFEEYSDGLSIAGSNGWFGALNAANISTDSTLIGKLSAYTNCLEFPIPGASHDQILCVNPNQVISNRIVSGSTTLFTDFMWLPGQGTAPQSDPNDQLALYVTPNGLLTIWHEDGGTNEFHTLVGSPVIGECEWIRVTVEQNYTGDRYQVRVNQQSPISDAKGWDAPSGGSQPGTWFNMVNKSGSMNRFSAHADIGAAYLDDLQVELTDPVGPPPTTSTSTTSTTSTGTSTTSILTTSTTSSSSTSTTSVPTTSTTSSTSPFGGSHDVTFTYSTGGYFSFESGDIDPGLAFGHGFLTPGSGDGARFDFWFAPDGVIDGSGVDGGGGATPGGNYAAGGDDVFMGSRTVNEDGVDQYLGGAGLDIDSFAVTGSALTNFTGPGFADGTVAAYGRVFENDNPQAGDWYSVSASEVIRNQDVVSNPPNTIPIGRGLGIGGLDPIDGTQWSFLVSATVPPPVIVDVNTDVTLWAVYTPTGMVTPMYSTNLGTVPIEWITVPVFSNTFVTGTNVITFDPPDTNSADVHFHLLQTF